MTDMNKQTMTTKKIEEFRNKWEGAYSGKNDSISTHVMDEMVKDILETIADVERETAILCLMHDYGLDRKAAEEQVEIYLKEIKESL